MKKIKPALLFLIFCLCFIGGIFVGHLLYLFEFFSKEKIDFLFWFYCLGIVLFIFYFLFSKKYYAKIIIIGVLVFCIGWLRFFLTVSTIDEQQISFYNNQKIEFIAKISNEPDRRIDQVKLTVQSGKILPSEKIVSGNVLVSANLFPEYFYGDLLKIKCKLQAPEKINDFAYDKYLAQFQIYSVCYYPEIALVQKHQAGFFSTLYKIKNNLKIIIQKSLPEPHSEIVVATLLGDKRKIPQTLLDQFNQVGISHIIAISGANIVIFATILLSIFIFIGFSRYKAFYLVSVSIFLYLLIIGFQASAIRAGIMVFIYLLARQLGRLSESINALIFTAVIMLLLNPLLLSDVGFQLSFTAVLGLIYLLPHLEKIFRKTSNFLQIKQVVLVSLSAQIAVFPIIVYYFKILSIVSLFANVLIAPIIPLIMILGIIVLIIGIFWLELASFVGLLLWLIINYLLWIVEILSFKSFSFVEMRMGIFGVVLFYGVLVLVIRKSMK
jgi:competence protein ComEC